MAVRANDFERRSLPLREIQKTGRNIREASPGAQVSPQKVNFIERLAIQHGQGMQDAARIRRASLEDAEDAAQEVLLAEWTKLLKGDAPVPLEDEERYLRRQTTIQVLNDTQGNSRLNSMDQAASAHDERSLGDVIATRSVNDYPEEVTERNYDVGQALLALQTLPQAEKEILVDSLLVGRSFAEIAEDEGVDEDSVRMRFLGSVSRLRTVFFENREVNEDKYLDSEDIEGRVDELTVHRPHPVIMATAIATVLSPPSALRVLPTPHVEPGESSLSIYSKQASRYPLLSAAQEALLFQYKEQGVKVEQLSKDPAFWEMVKPEDAEKFETVMAESRDIRDLIVNCNLRLVLSRVGLFYGWERPDKVQEGNIGLIKGVDRFDPSRKNKLSSYATWWIDQSISRGIAENGRTVQLPVYLTEALYKANGIVRSFQMEFSRSPNPTELAELLFIQSDLPESVIHNTIKILDGAAKRPASLDQPKIGYEDNTELLDFIADNAVEVELVAIEGEDKTILRNKLQQVMHEGLSAREMEILMLRNGWVIDEPQTLGQIGEEYNITRERVRQIEARALGKIRVAELRAWWEEGATINGEVKTSRGRKAPRLTEAKSAEQVQPLARSPKLQEALISRAMGGEEIWDEISPEARSIIVLLYRKGIDDAGKASAAQEVGLSAANLEKKLIATIGEIRMAISKSQPKVRYTARRKAAPRVSVVPGEPSPTVLESSDDQEISEIARKIVQQIVSSPEKISTDLKKKPRGRQKAAPVERKGKVATKETIWDRFALAKDIYAKKFAVDGAGLRHVHSRLFKIALEVEANDREGALEAIRTTYNERHGRNITIGSVRRAVQTAIDYLDGKSPYFSQSKERITKTATAQRHGEYELVKMAKELYPSLWDKLSRKQREVLDRYYLQDPELLISADQIAKERGVVGSTITRMLKGGVKKIRDQLQKIVS